jgi:hypothetical protein
MTKRGLAVGLLIFVPAIVAGWQIASAELSNVEFHDDLRYIAAQNGANIGLNSPKTDDQVRDDVISSAAEYGIRLQPDQITLQRIVLGEPSQPNITRFNLAVSYTTRVNLLLYSFDLHFNQTSAI